MLPAKPNLQWQLARQLGIDYAVTKAAPELTGMPDPSDYNSLKIVRDRFADAGFDGQLMQVLTEHFKSG